MTNIVKQVKFMEDTLTCIKNDDGVYVGIRWICQGLKLSDRQGQHQIAKVQSDVVLSQGVRKIGLLTNQGNQQVFCLEITYLPLWLAKINANIVEPEIQGKLVEYQLRAKDVLADAFVSQTNPQVNPSIPQLPQTYQEALRMLADSMDTIVINAPKVIAFDKFMSSKGNQTISQAAKALGTGRDRLFRFLRDRGILMSTNEPYQKFIAAGYFTVTEGTSRGYGQFQTLVTPSGIGFIYEVMESEYRHCVPKELPQRIETIEDCVAVFDKLKA